MNPAFLIDGAVPAPRKIKLKSNRQRTFLFFSLLDVSQDRDW